MKKCLFKMIAVWGLILLMTATAFAQNSLSSPGRNYTEQPELARNNNIFAMKIYQSLAGNSDDNLFFSPFSISSALAMTYLGASGKTADEMAETLEFRMSPRKLALEFQNMLHRLNQTGEETPVNLMVANRLWGDESYEFLNSFLKITEKFFEAPMERLDFRKKTEKSRNIINEWVEKRTGYHIKELLKPGDIDSSTSLVLTNTIYFKADWDVKFDRKRTHKAPFHLMTGDTQKVDMMQRILNIPYASTDRASAVAIPYVGRQFSMVVILPHSNISVEDFEKNLTWDMTDELIRNMESRKVQLFMPKFTTRGAFELSGVLQSLGMKLAFIPRMADFSLMSPSRDLSISKVIHESFVAVTEEGTEATAATAVTMMRTTSVGHGPGPVTFLVDRPFIFLITDDKSGQILFMGRIMNPAK